MSQRAKMEDLEATIDLLIYDFIGLGISMPKAMALRKLIFAVPEICDALAHMHEGSSR